jgi:hypothetical protein
LSASPLVYPDLSTPTGYPLPPEPLQRCYAVCLPDFLRALAVAPTAPLTNLAERAMISRSYAAHLSVYGRKTLGLRFGVLPAWGESPIEDEPRYHAWCAHLQVRPWSEPVPEPTEPAPVIVAPAPGIAAQALPAA